MSKNKSTFGCVGGCLVIVIVGFILIIGLGLLGSSIAEKEWEKKRSATLTSMEQSLSEGDYATALSIGNPYRDRNDPKLNDLLSKANELKRVAEVRQREERIAKLISEIESAEGEQRTSKLMELLEIAPNTQAFPEEVQELRIAIKKREEEARAKAEQERLAELEKQRLAREEQQRLAREAELARFRWKYHSSVDQLTDKTAYTARVTSLNQINFDFPYNGHQRGALILRKHPEYGEDLILRVDKGQMLVRSYEDSTVRVVFDGADPISFGVVGPSDNSTTSLFFRDKDRFVARMKNASVVKISVPFYQEGNVVFEFNVADFDQQQYLDAN